MNQRKGNQKEIKRYTKTYENSENFTNASKSLDDFASVRSILIQDFRGLIKMNRDLLHNQRLFNALYRTLVKELFSLIESDLQFLVSIDPYPEFSDSKKISFEQLFKRTYKQVYKTWNLQNVQKQYFDQKIQKLMILRKLRNDFVHPKNTDVFNDVTLKELDKIENIFNYYYNFTSQLIKVIEIGGSPSKNPI